MANRTLITWDLGATKCAASIVIHDEKTKRLHCLSHHSIKLKSCQSFTELVQRLETALDISMKNADAICIGAAGQYDGHCLRLENGYPYPMRIAEIAEKQSWPPYVVVHDYTPIVCATFTSYMENPGNIKQLIVGKRNKYGRRIALGVGTGLGLKDGILLPNGDFWLGTNEMGHIGITHPPHTDPYYIQRHFELMRYLRSYKFLRKNEPVSFEKILSGEGTARLHHFVHQTEHCFTPEEVGEQCRTGKANETVALIAWYLGLFVGAVQLTFMPKGGIWMTGGVLLNHLDIFDHPDFYKGIQASPAYYEQRQDFPLGVLCNREHAFLGGAYYTLKRLIKS